MISKSNKQIVLGESHEIDETQRKSIQRNALISIDQHKDENIDDYFYGICGEIKNALRVFSDTADKDTDIAMIAAMMCALVDSDCNTTPHSIYNHIQFQTEYRHRQQWVKHLKQISSLQTPRAMAILIHINNVILLQVYLSPIHQTQLRNIQKHPRSNNTNANTVYSSSTEKTTSNTNVNTIANIAEHSAISAGTIPKSINNTQSLYSFSFKLKLITNNHAINTSTSIRTDYRMYKYTQQHSIASNNR